MQKRQIRMGEMGNKGLHSYNQCQFAKELKLPCAFFCHYSLIQKESTLFLGHEWQKLHKSQGPYLCLAKVLNTDRKVLTTTSS